MGSKKQHQDIINEIKKSDTQKVKVAITDLDGILRGKYIHKEKFLKAVEGGFGFCNVVFGWDSHDVAYDNAQYTGWHTGYPDAQVKIDLDSYRRVPWDNNVAFFLGEFVTDNAEPLAVCPRQTTKRVLKRATDAGYVPYMGLEFEWFNFNETPQSLEEKSFHNPTPLTPGMFGYSVLRSSLKREYFNALMDQLSEFNVPLEGLHTETGPGVYEAAILASSGLLAADRAVLFKSGVREIAYRHEVVATFMARWNTTLPGCSGHIHQSLRNQEGENVFFDQSATHKMSDNFRSYLAGQMHCLPELLVMFAPNINSYKRLVEGFWAPTSVTYGIDNRTTAFRVIPGSQNSTRLETRVSGSDINPYLAVAASIAAGMYGIENKLPLKADPTVGNAYQTKGATPLPRTLMEATERFHRSEIASEFFGKDFVEHYCATREWEWRQFQKVVTDWEMKRYFELA